MKITFQLEIPRRNGYCAYGNESFVPGMEYYSVLFENLEHEGIDRRDYCLSCWESFARREIGEKALSYWKSCVVEKKNQEELYLNRDEKILALLNQALLETTDEAIAEAFVLGLYLARRRKLVLRQELKKEDGVFLLYELMATEEMLCVKKVTLTESQVKDVQGRIAIKLQE